MDAVGTATPPKLDVVRLLLAAVVAPIFHKRALVWFALPVAAADFASRALESRLAGLFNVAGMIAVVVLTIACYRVFILGPQSTAGHSFQWWALRVARIFGWGIVIGFICAVVALPALIYVAREIAGDPAVAEAAMASMRTRFIVFLLMLPALYVLSRLTLVLPAVATIEAPGNLAKAWRISAGNGLRLAFVVSFLPALLLDVLLVPLTDAGSLPVQAFLALLVVYVVAVQAAAVSTAYRELSHLSPPQ